jgi:hypothetical protein
VDNKINDGGRAFPVTGELDTVHEPGMSLRDWLAGQALPALIRDGVHTNHIGTAAYEIADAMLAARSR